MSVLLAGFLGLTGYIIAPAAQTQELKSQIDKLIQSKTLKRAGVAVEVYSISRGASLYSHNADKPLMPASNMKLITTATALKQLGPDYRFPTLIATDSIPEQGIVKGNLYIKGFGDPFLVYEELWKLTHHLAMKGLKQIKGDVVADDSYFDDERWGSDWKISGNRWYEAQIGALSFNFNTIEVDVEPGESSGSPLTAWLNPTTSYVQLVNRGRTVAKGNKRPAVNQVLENGQHKIIISGNMGISARPRTVWRTVKNPAMYTATVFRDYLLREGVKIDGEVRIGKVPATAHELYTHKSKPLALIIRGLNKMSNNFTAEQILKTLGAEKHGSPGTAGKGLDVVRRFLSEVGVNGQGLELVDGSGLSRNNRLTTKAITRVLAYMYNDFSLRPEYLASLAVAGVDGTMDGRLNNSSAQGMIRAKTGRIRGVAALSGYVATKEGEILAFSMLMNNFKTSIENVQKLQDKICLKLMNLSRE